MVTLPKILTTLFLTTFISCKSHDYTPLIPKDTTNENEKKNTLFVFVGEKLDFTELPYEKGSMDGSFKAKYKILQRVYGNYPSDTIEFVAYDHYGIPAFSKYKNVLLFVSEYKGKYYHEKYQYNDVYKTKDGRWAGSYAEYDYGHSYNKNTTVKPEKIEFAEEVSYPTKIKDSDGKEIELSYPEPYFKIAGDKAIAVYGNYIEDLFKLKKEGVLTARELFGNKDANESEIGIQDVELADVKQPYDKDDLKFIAFWKPLAEAIKKSDIKKFKKISLDSLWICDSILTVNRFTKKCFNEIFDRELISHFGDSSNIRYTWTEADTSGILPCAKIRIIKVDRVYRFRQVEISKPLYKENPWTVYLDFIETKKGYKFYGCGYYGERQCCR